jgi:hypothetical protein
MSGKGGLAGTISADDGDKLAILDGEVHAAEGVNRLGTGSLVRVVQVLDLDQRLSRFHR